MPGPACALEGGGLTSTAKSSSRGETLRARSIRQLLAALAAVALLAAACSESGEEASPEEDPEPVEDVDVEEDPEPVEDVDVEEDPEPVEDVDVEEDPEPVEDVDVEEDPEPVEDVDVEEDPEPAAVSDPDGAGLLVLDWSLVHPIYIPQDTSGSDPFFHIHTDAELDGFYMSFELYTVWGEAWTGDTGVFDITCIDPVTSTGLCIHFDPDGPGPLGDTAADFGATGTMLINQLDEFGYDLEVTGLTFTDGTAFAPFTISG